MKSRRSRGRPHVHDEAWSKVSVVLFDRQVARLDDIADTIRSKTDRSISRATLIRALVEALLESRLDLSSARSEADLTEAIVKRLKRERPPTPKDN
jgi:hypothetical protein